MKAPYAKKPPPSVETRPDWRLPLALSVLPFIAAILFYQLRLEFADIPVASLLQAHVHGIHPELKRVSIGYNSNLDLIVHNATDLFAAMGLEPTDQQNHASIATRTQLAQTLSYFFSKGSAAERFIADPDLFKSIIENSKKLHKKDYFIGGNAALMAQRFAEKGCAVHLGGAVGATLKSLLHESIATAESGALVDEVHLILEYKKGSTWGNLKAPRANRFIVVRDLTNAALAPLEEFHDLARRFGSELVIIAGLHLLEGQDEAFREKRLGDVLSGVRELPLVHFELASVGSAAFLEVLLRRLLPAVDSLGLNEQELGASFLATGGTDAAAADFVQPTPDLAARAMLHLLGIGGRLRRIHFHSLSFHVIAVRGDAWPAERSRAAVAAASLATSRQACDSAVIVPASVDLLFPRKFTVKTDAGERTLHLGSGVVEWAREGVTFYLAPVLVCRVPVKTVGLGDIISATGLLYNYPPTNAAGAAAR